jgi:hypothetical protein
MNAPLEHTRNEFERIRRGAKLHCTGHAALRDRYTLYAAILDLAVLALSGWIATLSFVDSKTAALVTPFTFEPRLWSGILAVVLFLLSRLLLRVDWKGRADSHDRSFAIYAEVKRMATNLLLSQDALDPIECGKVAALYRMAAVVATAIPETELLRQKRRHLTRTAVSKYLESHPSASVPMVRVLLWLRDNLRLDLMK